MTDLKSSTIRVIVVDDHALVREGLKSLLREEADMSVVAEARDGSELIAVMSRVECDIVVLDITMPGKSGLDLLHDLRKQFPKTPILMLTMHPEDRFAERAFKLGASGYVTKDSVPRELMTAIRKVTSGGIYVSPEFGERVVAHLGPKEKEHSHGRLSDREFQILRLIAMGKDIEQIARDICLSKGTVYTYRSRILDKLGLTNDSELTRYAFDNKLVD